MININGIPIDDIFFTADTHFGHRNILEYANRPYADTHEMNTEITENWNATVGPDSVVYHLGDLTLEDKAATYLSKLNGRIHILKLDWHHDRRWIARELGKKRLVSKSGWDVQILPPMEVLRLHEIKIGDYPMLITLCHYPVREWEGKHFGAWHLHGHSHGAGTYGDNLQIDVGVDAQDYFPISLRTVNAEMNRIYLAGQKIGSE